MHGGSFASERLKETDEGLPTLSVVVPFTASEWCILDCLSSIVEMDYPTGKLDLVVVDDWGDSAIGNAVRNRFPSARLIRNPAPSGCDPSKQAGIDAAEGEVIALTDADCTVVSQWGRCAARNLADGAGAVTGPVCHPRTLVREMIGAADFQDYQAADACLLAGFPGCNFAVRREVFDRIAYYRSGELRGGSDRLTSWRLYSMGFSIRHDPEMLTYHAPPDGLTSLLRRRMSYGARFLLLRELDGTLPGGRITRLGMLAAPAYLSYKTVKDARCLVGMAARRRVDPLHLPLLLPGLAVLRLVDAVGIGLAVLKRISPDRPTVSASAGGGS